MFALCNIIFVIALILDNIYGITILGVGNGPLYGLYTLAVVIPGLADIVRNFTTLGKVDG